jgi:hypothetical protein
MYIGRNFNRTKIKKLYIYILVPNYFLFPGYGISLNFSELRDCLDLLDEDSELIQEICDPESEVDLNRRNYVKVKSKATDNVFKVRFTLVPTRGTALCFTFYFMFTIIETMKKIFIFPTIRFYFNRTIKNKIFHKITHVAHVYKAISYNIFLWKL